MMHSGVIRPELVRPQATASNVYKLEAKPKQVIIQPQNITLGMLFNTDGNKSIHNVLDLKISSHPLPFSNCFLTVIY